MSSFPLRRRCIVRSGMTTVSSRSWPKLLLPFDSSSPITEQDSDRSRRRLPMGSSDPSSSFFVVWPMMHTPAPERSSLSENQRPLASFQPPDWKYALVVPVTLVDRFFAPLITL